MANFRKYSTLLSLYLAQSIPMSFFSTVVPVIMRQENYSLASIGLLQLVKLPWILKFTWAPFIDKAGTSRNAYRRIILASEIFYAAIIVSIAFFDLSTSFTTIVVLMVIAFIASATQDIGTDAFAILSLKKKERSMGNSMQSAGTFLGTLVGSGILLIIYHYLGWTALLAGLAGFVLLALIPLMIYPLKNEPEEPGLKERNKLKKAGLKDILLFFKQKNMGGHVLILSLFYSGLIGMMAMMKPWMVDLGFETGKIGVIAGIYGTSIGALCAFAAGILVRKNGLKKTLVLFSLGNLIAVFSFTLMNSLGSGLVILLICVALLWGSYGMSTVAIYTLAMERVRPGREGTDFTLQIVITHLSSIIIAVSSGKIADVLGYSGLFIIESSIALAVFLMVLLMSELKVIKNEYPQEVIV